MGRTTCTACTCTWTFGADLDLVLHTRGIRNIVLTGVTTDGAPPAATDVSATNDSTAAHCASCRVLRDASRPFGPTCCPD